MLKTNKLPFYLFMFLTSFSVFSQKVGLVMSGGGAAGMAHIGVIKALEENGIPIDYISGTSAGALVGSMYSIGYDPRQLEHIATSQQMVDMSKGLINSQYNYYFKEKDPNLGIVSFKLDEKFTLTKILPVNFTDPSLIDFQFIEQYTIPSNIANNNFDSLFVPFRCVSADIDHNHDVVMKEGHLSQAVRASMSFPFYLPPIKVDGKLLLDGGLYNNFPVDVMYEEFLPDFIIGSSTTSIRKTPKQDDLLSQVRSMLQTKSNFKYDCKEGILIEPNVDDIGTFSFNDTEEAIKRGYDAAMLMMDSIKASVYRRVDSADLAKRRLKYLQQTHKEIIIDGITVLGVGKRQEAYIRSVLKDRDKNVSLQNLKPRYFKLVLDDKIKFLFPLLIKNPNNEFYTLQLEVIKEPKYEVRIGGNFSTSIPNTGYVGLDYKLIDRYFAMTTSLNTYFGRFYNSVDLSARIDFPLDLPFYIEPFGTFNRWDYYRSQSTFFPDKRPPFLVENETFWGTTIGIPAENNGKMKFSYKNGFLTNEYYQTDQFLSTDTADVTEFFFNDISLSFDYNSLDYGRYSKKGSAITASASYTQGTEINRPGSTSVLSTDTINRFNHEWITLKAKFEKYFSLGLDYKLGIELEGVHTTQKFFNNYTASALIAPQYNPTQETKTLFIDEHTAHTYIAGGLKNVFPIFNSIDLRVEGYVFQPYRNILSDNNKKAIYSSDFQSTKRRYILSSSLVWHFPLGPVSLTANYMDHRREKWSFMLNFNYTLFNRKALN